MAQTSFQQRDEVATSFFSGRISRQAFAQYAFAVDAGAVGTIDLKVEIPLNAVITHAVTDTPTNLTSGGSATVQILVGAQSIVAAAAFDTAYDSPNEHALVNTEPIKVTTTANIKIAIATAALTAGVLNIWLEYLIAGPGKV
jgi:hypothetical protein